MIVIDTSFAVAWLMPDERCEKVNEVFEQINTYGALVPSLWYTEVANALLMAFRRRRVTLEHMNQSLLDLAEFPIQTDGETLDHAWQQTLQLAHIHRLTCYDATYLELAIRAKAKIATFDSELAHAARHCGVQVL